jgi:hypothetical protein
MNTGAMTMLGVLDGFRRRPWSVSRALAASMVMGTLGAFFQVLLFRVGPFELTYILYVAPAAFWVTAGSAIWILYRQMEKGQFRSNIRAIVGSLLALVLFVVGVYGAAWCYSQHVCMDGHMAHSPYPAWHYLLDSGWVACLASSSIWLWRTRSVLAAGLTAFAAFLVCFRFLLGSAGGMYGGFPL